jgi:hypothetical protein
MGKLKGGQQKDMGLLMQNIKPCNSSNGREDIPNNIMGCNPLPTMGVIKKINHCWI